MFSAPSFWGPKMCFGDGQPAKVAALGGFRMDFVALIKPTKKQRKQQIQKQNRCEGTQKHRHTKGDFVSQKLGLQWT